MNSLNPNDALEFQKIEYDNLNKEIQENANKVFLILNLSVPAVAGFIGIALTASASLPQKLLPFLLLLVPFAIILPAMQTVISSLMSTVRIATYIKVFYEDELGVCLWQSSIQKLREKNKGEKIKYRAFQGSLQMIFLALALICIISSFGTYFFVSKSLLNAYEAKAYFILVVLLILGFSISLVRLHEKWSAEYFKGLISQWEAIKNTTTGPAQGNP